MGEFYYRKGENRAARQYYERALQVDEAFYGPNHSNVAGRAMQLAQILRIMGDKDGAQALYSRIGGRV